MNKTDMINAMAESTGMTKADCGKALTAFVDELRSALQRGENVMLQGFGTFGVKEYAARLGVKPGTTERVTIPAHKVPIFKPGNYLKDSLN